MDDLIDDLTKIPLSGDDLINITTKLGKDKSKLAWITYDALAHINSLMELFKNGDIEAVFLLIQPPGQPIGHWVVLSQSDNGLSYYDPYGLTIEEDISITMANNRLLQLLHQHFATQNLSYQVDVNMFKHQEFGTDNGGEINTCGRHDAVRAFFSWMTNQEYNDTIIAPLVDRGEVKDPDTIVNLLTAFLSQSDKVIETFLMKKNVAEEPKLQGSRLPKIRHSMRSVGGVLFL